MLEPAAVPGPAAARDGVEPLARVREDVDERVRVAQLRRPLSEPRRRWRSGQTSDRNLTGRRRDREGRRRRGHGEHVRDARRRAARSAAPSPRRRTGRAGRGSRSSATRSGRDASRATRPSSAARSRSTACRTRSWASCRAASRCPPTSARTRPSPTQLWVPRAAEAEELRADYGSHGDYTVGAPRAGRLRRPRQRRPARASRAQLTDEGAFPREMEFEAFAVRLDDEIVGPWRPALLLLTGAVGAPHARSRAPTSRTCSSRAAEGRHREMAVRSALGAGRGRLARQLLTEGFVLALAAAGLSLLLARAALHLLQATAAPARAARARRGRGRRARSPSPSRSRSRRRSSSASPPRCTRCGTALAESLKEGGRGRAASRRRRWRGGLIVAEIAFAVVLAIGAGLMARTLAQPRPHRPRHRPVVRADGRPLGAAGRARGAGAGHRPLRAARSTRCGRCPGVRHAGLLRSLPLGQTIGDWGIVVEGFDHGPSGHGAGGLAGGDRRGGRGPRRAPRAPAAS